MSRHSSALLSHPFSRPEPALASARPRQVPKLSGRHIPFFNTTIITNRSTCSTMCQDSVMEYRETISNFHKNSADDPANGARIPANDCELISLEHFSNISDFELVEALARLYQMKQTPPVRAAELCLRAEINSRSVRL
jgi:hypothetical protein